jgi:hypothetical protein
MLEFKRRAVITNYNNDLEWLVELQSFGYEKEEILIYDRSEVKKDWSHVGKVIEVPNVGENIFDICHHIVENYESLADVTLFVKGNLYPRQYTTRENFERALRYDAFAPIERIHPEMDPHVFVSCDGGYMESNTSWYCNHHPSKYFNNYNTFLKYMFESPPIPMWVRFAPGGNYLVPKANILRRPKSFWSDIRTFVGWNAVPAEAHIVERALYTIFDANLECHSRYRGQA